MNEHSFIIGEKMKQNKKKMADGNQAVKDMFGNLLKIENMIGEHYCSEVLL